MITLITILVLISIFLYLYTSKNFKRKLKKARRIMNYLICAGTGFLDQRKARGNVYQFAKALLRETHPVVNMFLAEYFRNYSERSRLQRMSDQGLLVAFL